MPCGNISMPESYQLYLNMINCRFGFLSLDVCNGMHSKNFSDNYCWQFLEHQPWMTPIYSEMSLWTETSPGLSRLRRETVWIIKSPGETEGLIAVVRFRHHRLLHHRSANTFQLSGKPLKLISSNHTWLTDGFGKIFGYQSWCAWVKVTKLPKRDRF